MAGLQAGFMVWLGFVATISAANAAFGNRGWTLWEIDASNHLMTLRRMGQVPTLMPLCTQGKAAADGRPGMGAV